MSWLDQGRQQHGWFCHGHTSGGVRLAQAMGRTSTDAASGSMDVAEPAPGRYVADNPRQWIGQGSVTTGECVALVQRATGAPQTTAWRPGVLVRGTGGIRPGTAIATFDKDGKYEGHAAIFLSQNANGIEFVDQWNICGGGKIILQHPPSERTLHFNEPWRQAVDQGELYRVIE